MKVTLENIRCFGSPVEAEVRPLTILVGENSSGKSTFLAAYAAMMGSQSQFPSRLSLNVPPFELGNFDTLATLRRGKAGRAKFVTMGYEITGTKNPRKVTAEFAGRGSESYLSRLSVESGDERVLIEVLYNANEVQVSGHFRDNVKFNERLKYEDDDQEIPSEWFMVQVTSRFFLNSIADFIVESTGMTRPSRILMLLMNMSVGSRFPPLHPIHALAPLRAKPRRTYDVVSEKNAPEGDDLPQLLAELIETDSTAFDALKRVGVESGLFTDLFVRKLGRKSTDPVQVEVVDCGGNRVNLADVGYGVSQVLPILLHCLSNNHGGSLLLQQPEVHLHPRAQAALGTLLTGVSGDRNVLVETHSDYLIDRVCLDIRQGRIKHKNVSLLFFDKQNKDSSIWSLSFDKNGNLEGAPPHYRSFFLDEQRKMLESL